jgi:2-C-methyl-D-erythritol 4-phosphate cytidylyltransferase
MKTEPFRVVLLAGGTGKRMGQAIPKQYIHLKNKPLVLYSFETFLSLPEVEEIVVVCDPSYQSIFTAYQTNTKLTFACPGPRRQDSLYNGIQHMTSNPLICVHDGVRPFIQADLIRQVVWAAKEESGAAVLGVPVKATIKICDPLQWITSTPDRTLIWEIQTPQVIRLNLLREGFELALSQGLTLTDDVSLVELKGCPVKVLKGVYHNIKVTTPDDWLLAEQLIGNDELL